MFNDLADRYQWTGPQIAELTLAQIWVAYTRSKSRGSTKIHGTSMPVVMAAKQAAQAERNSWVNNVLREMHRGPETL